MGDGNVGQRRAGLQPHVVQCIFNRLLFHQIGFVSRIGHVAADGAGLIRADAPGDFRFQIAAINGQLPVKYRIIIAAQRAPLGQRLLPQLAHRHLRFAGNVSVDLVIRRDNRPARTGFHCHVTQRHTPFHAQRIDRAAGKLNRIPRSAGCANLFDQRQHDVFGGAAKRQLAGNFNAHGFQRAINQCLCRQQVLDFRGADAKPQRAKRPVSGGMAVAGGNHHPRHHQPLLVRHHMFNALSRVEHVKQFNAKVLRIFAEVIDLQLTACVGHRRIAHRPRRVHVVNVE